ncbi:MAG: addiction module antitoxin [Candidatus Lindowbacteria bacterium RIFCSPLOWO2_12_FULL_62_27]|nr:MAG: addiction module antitoxin [Candidatus Lindowbacteria bacterium RIFCSPLOWO2_12_FULL_62_27]OGH58153.1 MAG: addiction module antitoxin [Candidatus Lindowbacteria bacterium RIFCSPLOWO2_02_FULL_62_12]
MKKKLTLSVDREIYDGLRSQIGARRISGFIESLLRPHVVKSSLEEGYARMSRDKDREKEARRWAEQTVRDIAREKR